MYPAVGREPGGHSDAQHASQEPIPEPHHGPAQAARGARRLRQPPGHQGGREDPAHERHQHGHHPGQGRPSLQDFQGHARGGALRPHPPGRGQQGRGLGPSAGDLPAREGEARRARLRDRAGQELGSAARFRVVWYNR